ncbi:hypothetical protein EV182_003302, partial [Spiromyces aspiralis]
MSKKGSKDKKQTKRPAKAEEKTKKSGVQSNGARSDKPTPVGKSKTVTMSLLEQGTATDFPRGGSTGLTPLEFRDISEQAKHEVLFKDGVIDSSKEKVNKKRRHIDDEGKDSPP